MSIEDRLSESLARNLDQLVVPAGDVGAARRTGERQRRQRTWTTGLAAAAVLAVVATGVAVARSGNDGNRLDPAPSTGSWTPLPDAPLSPRTGGIAVWTGSEAIFLGGQIDNLCPPTADCVDAPTYGKDGAAYDPASRSWRTIAPAPLPVAAYMSHAVVGDTLVLVDDSNDHQVWHAYDITKDTWRRLPDPPRKTMSTNDLSVLNGNVYTLASDSSVQLLDLSSAAWSTLPMSQHEPRIDPQLVVATPEGIVVTGVESSVTAANDGTVPSWVFAEVYANGSWTRLERSDMVGGYGWHWTGERLVAPDLGCVDGGEVNPYGRCIPQGGMLDPETGTWAELPNAPKEGGLGGWHLNAGGSGPLMTSYGYVYDDSAGSWTTLPKPAGGPDYDIGAVWADGTLIAFGGIDSEKGWGTDALSSKAWSWTP